MTVIVRLAAAVVRLLLALISIAAGSSAAACELALAFAVDISGSVDAREFRIQMQGIASGLRDGVVSEALVRSNASVLLVQWTGSSRQVISVPWTTIRSFEDVETVANRIEKLPRAWRSYSTAIGEAIAYTVQAFDGAPSCERRVIDVSGDGVSNEGAEPGEVTSGLRASGITINALVIEGVDDDLTAYFWENVITGEGAFVVTADGFDDYPARMRLKLVREVTKQISGLPVDGNIRTLQADYVITK